MCSACLKERENCPTAEDMLLRVEKEWDKIFRPEMAMFVQREHQAVNSSELHGKIRSNELKTANL